MAKKTVTDREMRQMLASRQGRVGGRFAGLKPEFKTPPVAAATNVPTSGAAETGRFDFLQAIINERKAMGIETSELEEYVVGTAQKQGVRSAVEAFIAENREQFNQDDPAGAAAYELMKEAVVLSEASMKASFDDSKKIYAQLQFLRKIAANAKDKNAALSKQMEDIIAPVEAQLKKRTSFAAFIKDKAESFKKTLPERLAAKVPVVGGLLSGFLRDKREAQESIELLSGRMQENVSRGGQKGKDLDIDDIGQPRKSGGTEMMGGTRASDIPGLDLGGAGKGIPSTLGAIYKEVTKIRTIIESKFAPVESDATEIKAREAELEAKTGGGKVSEKAIKMVTGEKGGGGFLSSLLSNLLGSGLGPLLAKGLVALAPMILGAVGAIGTALMAAIAGLGTAIAAIGSTLLAVAIPALVATVGAAIGGGLAWLINSGIDAIFGTNLSELMMEKDTYTFGDVDRENKIAEQGKAADARIEAQRNTPEYTAAMSQDPRMLPKLIRDKKITGSQALDALGEYESKYGAGEDTASIRNQILQVDPSATSTKTGQFAAVNAAQSATSAAAATIPSVSAGTGSAVASDQATTVGVLSASTPNTTAGLQVDSSATSTKTGQFAAVNAAQSATAAATIPSVSAGTGSAVASDQATTVGVLSASTPNTTAGKMLSQYSAEQAALSKAQAAGTATTAGTVNNSSVNTRVSNVVNNFNDDLRIRNNEPTQKQMQTFSLVP